MLVETYTSIDLDKERSLAYARDDGWGGIH